MCLKIDENGRAVFYRQRGLLFGAQSDVFPFTVKDDVKVQWLENDVCALTYESPEDDQVHQFVAELNGDRNEAVILLLCGKCGLWYMDAGRPGRKL